LGHAARASTRARKDYVVDEDDRRGEWIATADPNASVPRALARWSQRPRPREPCAFSATDVDAALAKLEQISLHFDRRASCGRSAASYPRAPIRRASPLSSIRSSPASGIVCVHEPSDPLSSDRYTTPRLAELERCFIFGGARRSRHPPDDPASCPQRSGRPACRASRTDELPIRFSAAGTTLSENRWRRLGRSKSEGSSVPQAGL
jgi:hypothetical protein